MPPRSERSSADSTAARLVFERQYQADGFRFVAGIDEAGRGPWAGPVVAACAVLDPETVNRWGHILRSARDSKQLSPERRETLAAELRMVLPAWAVAEVDNHAIDRENILQATLDAMRQCVSHVSLRPRILFVDGDRAPGTGLPERLLVEGIIIQVEVYKMERDFICQGHPGGLQ